MNQVAATIRSLAFERGVMLTTDVAADTGLVLADAAQLQRVLSNLVANAITCSRASGTVIVSTRKVAAEVEVTVADTGVGIPVEEQAGLFTPFFRPTVGGHAAGNGLGLLVVKQIVESHGGAITVQSTPGSGTTVRFTLPYLAQGSNR